MKHLIDQSEERILRIDQIKNAFLAVLFRGIVANLSNIERGVGRENGEFRERRLSFVTIIGRLCLQDSIAFCLYFELQIRVITMEEIRVMV